MKDIKKEIDKCYKTKIQDSLSFSTGSGILMLTVQYLNEYMNLKLEDSLWKYFCNLKNGDD